MIEEETDIWTHDKFDLLKVHHIAGHFGTSCLPCYKSTALTWPLCMQIGPPPGLGGSHKAPSSQRGNGLVFNESVSMQLLLTQAVTSSGNLLLRANSSLSVFQGTTNKTVVDHFVAGRQFESWWCPGHQTQGRCRQGDGLKSIMAAMYFPCSQWTT